MKLLLLGHAPSIHTQRWARAHAARGHEVRLLSVASPTAPGAGTEDVAVAAEPIGLPHLPVSFLRYAAARGAVRRVLAAWRPDLTVAHFLPNYGFLAALAGARPFALVAWGSDLLVNARRTPLHAARARWVLERADLIHVDAENLAEAARSLGAPPDRVWTRPWGVETKALAPVVPWGERVRAAGVVRILWNRMHEPIYDPATFLEACGLWKSAGFPFRATMAGDGPLRPALESAAAARGMGGDIRFVGRVSEARMRELYREHEVYVSMSRSDSTSQSLLEAMAAGLFPIVSDIPGNRPWIGSDAGTRVPCGDAAALAEAVVAALGPWTGAGPSQPALAASAARVEVAIARVRASADWETTVTLAEDRFRAIAEGARR
jgi:glycosyltransferase involved in cell wall biosynthesis